MKKLTKLLKKMKNWLLVAVGVLAIGGFFGYRHYLAVKNALPPGIASGNGRIEAKEVDVASKLPLRVKSVFVEEGDLVKPGQILVQMDTSTLETELAEAQATVVAAREQVAVTKAAIYKRTAEIDLAKIEKERSKALWEERAGSKRDYDVRSTMVKTTTAGLGEDFAKLQVAEANIKVAEANVATIQSRITDATLRAPVTGRVLYRLAEPGEVLGIGGKAITLVNLEDVYMEIFLPSEQAAALKLGAEARFTVDHRPNQVAAGYVSFVSPEAQFTPKEVETKSEREKLMFRVKIQVPKELVGQYIEQIKTGTRGVGYVKLNEGAVWPESLQKNLIAPATAGSTALLPTPIPMR